MQASCCYLNWTSLIPVRQSYCHLEIFAGIKAVKIASLQYIFKLKRTTQGSCLIWIRLDKTDVMVHGETVNENNKHQKLVASMKTSYTYPLNPKAVCF